MKSMICNIASETPNQRFLHVSYTFPTFPHRVGFGVGNVGNLYSFLRSYAPRCAAVSRVTK